MKKANFLLLLSFLFSSLLFSQPVHFSFTSNTGESYSIVISNATLNGSPLANGDEIGVSTPADLCVGASVWDGTTPLALTAWKDDSQTTNVDGYVTGETMSFKIWDKSANQEFNATVNYAMGNGTFGDGFAAQLTLQAGGGATESITVVAPNGGEIWQAGTQQEIKWTSVNFTGQVRIEASLDGGNSFNEVEGSTENDGSFPVIIPNENSQTVRIKISDAADGIPFDVSDNNFTITPATAVKTERQTHTSSQFSLHQNYPNPFNPETTIPFSLSQDAKVTVKIFNVLGQEMITLLDCDLVAGEHLIQWNGADKNGVNVASGVYFYLVKTNGNNAVRKMVLMR